MEKYIIALDLDGTTIPNLYDISDYTIEVFKKLASLGHKVIITTGRPFRSSSFVYERMNLDTPIINYNGQYIHNPKDKNYVDFEDIFNRDEVLDIYNNTKDLYSHIFFESYDEIYANIDDEKIYPLMHYNDKSVLYTGDLNEILNNHVHGSLILAKKGKGKLILDYINNNHKNIGARMWSWMGFEEIVELYSLKSDKTSSFDKVRTELGFDKEHTIVTGDSMNDIYLFSDFKFSVCPSNANPLIKEKAKYVLNEDCSNDSIARFFNDYFNLGIKHDN